MNHAHDTVTKMLTSYRVIPAMYRVMLGTAPEETKRELSRILGVNPRNVYAFLTPYKDQIVYAMQDFRHYVDLIGDIPTFEEAYWPAMNEEAKLVKNIEPFRVPIEHITILDIGAGCLPYLPYFQMTNKEIAKCIAVDKRYQYGKNPPGIGIPLEIIPGSFEERFMNHDCYAEVLFLGNFLHCLEDIGAFFTHILPCLPNLKLIKILEIKPDCNLDFLFDYHMAQHCGGQKVTAETVEKVLNKPVEIDTLGDYHNMYTVEL